ncbi:Peptidyl-prolyl cis-trans isomerase [Armadillidium nasatum]|uniref:Peptidyl-prolyl cis-trans isomerase n=1 Tax=Armadillidium nasatum TaxID=96803 RepID=A0A5N5SWY1_9CRUS|nr:Peptidyl-prolyl cis-trans isomerase [Armadillidium nasatum]
MCPTIPYDFLIVLDRLLLPLTVFDRPLRPLTVLDRPLWPLFVSCKPVRPYKQTCRVVIELRPDKAPKLCENFIRLCTGKSGYGFTGSKIFRCLPGWWIQGGDFETNNGEGGRSAMEAELIPAETTDLEPRPGALEMLCVSTNREGNLMVGSQFFVHVKKYSYTHVFGYVLDGLDLIESLSKLGNPVEVYRPIKYYH